MELKNTFKKLSNEIKEKILEQLKTKEFKEIMSKIKEAEDSGRFEVIISTGDIDRTGEVLDPKGWDIDFYKANPIVLWAHDYTQLPIGITDNIEIKDGKLIASGRFAPADANPFAQQVRKLYDLGFQRATSVGFIEKERNGNIITKAELLEWSFVPVPANPFALSIMKNSGIDTVTMITKGIIFPTKDNNKESPEIGQKPEPETEGNYIIIRVKDPDYFDSESFRTIDISQEQGIKATIGCKKGEYKDGKCQIGTEVQRYLFDKEKWTLSEAEAWVEKNKKSEKQEKNNLTEIVGAELTQLQSKIDELIIEHSKRIIDLLNSKSNAILEEKLQGDKSGAGTNKGREPAGLKELEEWLFFRQILQKIDIITEEGLRKFKKKIKSSVKK
jgi:hypothetical protein